MVSIAPGLSRVLKNLNKSLALAFNFKTEIIQIFFSLSVFGKPRVKCHPTVNDNCCPVDVVSLIGGQPNCH